MKPKPSSGRLQYTTGTKEVAANINRTGGGAYFPIKAVQSFNAETGHIRNGCAKPQRYRPVPHNPNPTSP